MFSKACENFKSQKGISALAVYALTVIELPVYM